MNLTGKVINNTFIIKDLIDESDFMERWEAKAIFSPNTFFFDLVKSRKYSKNILKKKDLLSKKLLVSRAISNPFVLKTIEFGEYNNHFYYVQQKVSGKNLFELEKDDFRVSQSTALIMMKNLLLCLKEFERLSLFHNLLTPRSIWISDNYRSGSIYIGDTFLFLIMSLAQINLDKHFNEPDSCIFYQSYSDGIYKSNHLNDLHSFSTLFYKLIIGRSPYYAASFDELKELQKSGNIDLGPVSNENIKFFLSPELGKNIKFPTIESVYNEYQRIFGEQLDKKAISDERVYTSAGDSIHSDEIQDKVIIAEELEEVVDETSGESETTTNSSIKNRVDRIFRTVFGFLDRFRGRKRGRKKGKANSIKFSVQGRDQLHEVSTGYMDYSHERPDPERLKRLLEEMASHFKSDYIESRTNIHIDPKKYDAFRLQQRKKDQSNRNERESVWTLRENSASGEGVGRVMGPKSKYTKANPNPLLRYLLKESSYISHEYKKSRLVEQEFSSKVSLKTDQPVVSETDLEISSEKEVIENRNTLKFHSDIGKNPHESINVMNDAGITIPEGSIVDADQKLTFWLRLWVFIKKIFKFIK